MVEQNIKKITSIFGDVKFYFREYCKHTSVHGFQYLAEKQRTLFERIWWLVLLLGCLIACVMSVIQVYHKWDRNAVIVTFANRPTSISSIPFPAITICPESKFSKNKLNYTLLAEQIKSYLDTGENFRSEQLNYIKLMCNKDQPEIETSTYNASLKDFINLISDKFSEELQNVMNEVKPEIYWEFCPFSQKNDYLCEDYFASIITDEGLCYTFNILNRSEIFRNNVLHYRDFHTTREPSSWSPEVGYAKSAKANTYPVRALTSGAKNGRNIDILTANEDIDYGCRNSEQGYRVLIHNPMNIPYFDEEFFALPLNQSVVAAVKPTVMTTAESLKKYNSQRRGCYFQSERHLKYFKLYSATNCKLECLANYTLSLCGCVHFFLPRIIGTKICDMNKIFCMKRAEALMTYGEIKNEWELYQSENRKGIGQLSAELDFMYRLLNKEPPEKCDCLPTCSDLTYEVVLSQSDIKDHSSLLLHNKSHKSSLSVFFKSNQFIGLERDELYGPIDCIANFGGLLGLFCGFSVISFVEMLYFLTVRLFCNKWLLGFWTGSTNNDKC